MIVFCISSSGAGCTYIYSRPLNNMGLNCTVLRIHGIFFDKYVNVFSIPYDFLINIFFSLAYFIIRIQCIIHIMYKICVNLLFVL